MSALDLTNSLRRRCDATRSSATRPVDFIGEEPPAPSIVLSDPATRQLYALKHSRAKNPNVTSASSIRARIRIRDRPPGEYPACAAASICNTPTLLRKLTDAALIMEWFDGRPLDMLGLTKCRKFLTCSSDRSRTEPCTRSITCTAISSPNNILVTTPRMK